MKISIPQIENGRQEEITIEPCERILILGPNGAGKSKLGAYIESQLCNEIANGGANKIQNNNDENEIVQQQILMKQNEIENIKNSQPKEYQNHIRNYKNAGVYKFIPNSLNRKEILKMLLDNNIGGSIEFHGYAGNVFPPRSLEDWQSGIVKIEGVEINIEIMKVNEEDLDSVQKYIENEINKINLQIENLKSTKLGFKKINKEGSETSKIKFCHRISGHRSLIYGQIRLQEDPQQAVKNLIGDPSNLNIKWGGKPTGGLQADFEKVLEALIADEISSSLKYKQHSSLERRPITKLDNVIGAWNELLQNRKMKSSGADVRITSENGEYKLEEGSEGEKTIFYILGQCLMAPENSLIIIDEPEIHVNKSILSTLFDKIEYLRQDCAFIYITHDIEFSKTRLESKILIIKNYKAPNSWESYLIPTIDVIPNDIIMKIAGARKRILFCEGDKTSLDTIYKKIYNDFTVIPVGSCKDVINITKSFNSETSLNLHFIDCWGLIDGDNQSNEHQRIKRLKVSFIENIFLIPDMAKILYKELHTDWPGDEKYLKKVVEWVSAGNNVWRNKNIYDKIKFSIENTISAGLGKGEGAVIERSIINVCDIKNSVFNAIEDEKHEYNNSLRDVNINNDIVPLLKIHRGKELLSKLASELQLNGRMALINKILKIENDEFLSELRSQLPLFET